MKLHSHRAQLGKSRSFRIDRFGKWSLLIASTSLVGAIALINYQINNTGDSFAIEDSYFNVSNAIINPQYEKYLEDVANGEGDKWNLVPNKYIASAEDKEPEYLQNDFAVGALDDLPARYNLRELGLGTPIKNQGAEGICWAYAITSAAESYLLKNYNLNIELSPKQLDYLIADGTPTGDYIGAKFSQEAVHQLGSGYNFNIASQGFNSGYTPVEESDFFALLKQNDNSLSQYSSWQDYMDHERMKVVATKQENPYVKPMDYDEVTSVENGYIITDYVDYLDTVSKDTIKKSIMENGAAYVGTIAPGAATFAGSCYDESTKTMIDRGATYCGDDGHALVIVGWDDEHEYTHPGTGATKKGAFILQNSWGKSDLFSKNNATYDSLVLDGTIDPSGMTDDEIQELKDTINNYDAGEELYLSYDFPIKPSTDFGIINGMVPDNYDIIFGPASDNYIGSSISDDAKELVFTYSAGSGTKYIDRIAIMRQPVSETYYGFSIYSIQGDIYIDAGNGFESVGNVPIFKNSVSFQQSVKLEKPIEVSGSFKLKMTVSAKGYTDNLTPFKEDYAMIAYARSTNDVTPEEPTDDPETEEPEEPTDDPEDPEEEPEKPAPTTEKEDLDVPATSAPNTGYNVKGSNSLNQGNQIYLLPSIALIVFSVAISANAFKKHVSFEKR